jgi:preprotein translocase subunit SecA
MEHLEAMDYLRSSVNLRAYGQREPIIEYKKEGLRMYKEMDVSYKEQVSSLIETINTDIKINMKEEESPKEVLLTSHNEPGEFSDNKKVSTSDKVGRNDPCPCGSGKKYKHCHGKLD